MNSESRCASGQVIEEGDWFYFFDWIDTGVYFRAGFVRARFPLKNNAFEC
jgi:hypothetical protein